MRFVLAVLVLAAPALAQTSDAVYVRQVEDAVGTSASALTGVDGMAVGAGLASVATTPGVNSAIVFQLGQSNITDITQIGSGNRVGISLVGNGNALSLLQNGDDNAFLGTVVGSGNVFDTFVQEGDGNTYTILAAGLNGQTHTVRQFGGGNEATQFVAPGMEPVSIEQRGGASIIIERR